MLHISSREGGGRGKKHFPEVKNVPSSGKTNYDHENCEHWQQ